jgi:proton glutamate symport protein
MAVLVIIEWRSWPDAIKGLRGNLSPPNWLVTPNLVRYDEAAGRPCGPMTLAFRVLAGLLAGFLVGLALPQSSHATASTIAVLAPVGTLFVNLIRMTVIPLLVSTVIASLGASATPGGFRRTGIRALSISIVLLAVAAVASLLISHRLMAGLTIDQAAALALRGTTTADTLPSSVTPTVAGWFIDLVPANVVKAAADGALLPLILFSVIFGLTLAQIDTARRDAVLRLVDGVAETMQRIVVMILSLAPIGVFALAVPLAARLGWSAAGAVVAYVALVVALTIAAVALILYPLGIVAGRMRPAAFTSYCAPAQAIAFASRSSLAALPAMLQSAERAGIRPNAARVVLPLAAAIFHFGAAVAQTVGVVFLARLYGVVLTPVQMVSVVAAVVLASFAVPGIPGGSILAMAPALAAAGLPLDGLAILLAADAIPDMFRTTANVTGSLTLTALLSARADAGAPGRVASNREEPQA